MVLSYVNLFTPDVSCLDLGNAISPSHPNGSALSDTEPQVLNDPLALIAELRAHSEQQRAIADLGRSAILSDDLQALMDEAVATVTCTLDMEFTKLLELQPGGDDLLLRAGIGWRPGLVGKARVPANIDSLAGYTLLASEPLIVNDLRTETRFRASRLLTEHGVVSGVSVVIRDRGKPYGVLGTHTTQRRSFSDDDVRFVRAVANIIGLAIQRQRNLDALEASEARYRSLAESTPAIVSTSDARGNLTYLNNRWYEYTGLPRDASEEARLAAIHPDDMPAVRERLRHALHGDEAAYTLEFRLRNALGEYRWHASRVVPLRDDRGQVTGWLNSSSDIHDQKLLEESLRDAADRLRRAQQAGRLGSFDWHVDTGDLIWDGVEEVHGMPRGSFGGTLDDYLRDVHPDDVQLVQETLRRAVEQGEPVSVRYRIVTPVGEMRWVEGKGDVERDAAGAITRVVGTCQDVTERRRLIEELQEANDAKDEFLSLVSHELRTPITTIYGNAEVLERRGAEIEEAARTEALRDIRISATRLSRIVTNLLVLARMDRGMEAEREPTLIRRIAERLIQEHQRMYPARPLELDAQVPLTPIMAARDYIEIAIRNLLSNAEKYSPPLEPIAVSVTIEGDDLVLSVADRGIGITDEEAKRLFTAFYRSRRAAEHAGGIGVGLAVCQRVIEAEGGRIWAEPRDGGGSVFSFALPIMSPEDEDPDTPADEDEAAIARR